MPRIWPTILVNIQLGVPFIHIFLEGPTHDLPRLSLRTCRRPPVPPQWLWQKSPVIYSPPLRQPHLHYRHTFRHFLDLRRIVECLYRGSRTDRALTFSRSTPTRLSTGMMIIPIRNRNHLAGTTPAPLQVRGIHRPARCPRRPCPSRGTSQAVHLRIRLLNTPVLPFIQRRNQCYLLSLHTREWAL
jgi:hypothetical protein